MAITQGTPRVVHLAGPKTEVNDLRSSAIITPGYLVEMHDDSDELKWRSNASATEQVAIAVALDQPELNKGVDDTYAAGDLVRAAFLAPGSVFWGLIPSGQDISFAELLQSNGDGLLKTAGTTTAAANTAKFQSLDAPGSVVVATRIRVQVIQ